MLTAGIVFLATYVAVALGRFPGLRLDRTGAAVVGAAFMVALRVVTPEQAYRLVDLGTLVLLFGMMVVVGHLRLSGFFRWAGSAVARSAATPRRLLAGLIAVSGALSALFVNDTVCLAFTPLVLEICAAVGARPLPYLLALATATNIGSAATITGNPQNMLIGVASGIPYRTFAAHLAPIAALGLLADFAVIALVYRRDLAAPFTAPPPPRERVHGFLLAKGLAATGAMLVFFLAGANVSMVALTAGAVLLLTRRVKTEKILLEINWNLLVLFAGLFVVVGAAREAGLAARAFDALHAREAHEVLPLTLVSVVLSNLVSNVPAVMLFTPLVPAFPDPARSWLTLAMATTLAGNLTLLGSIANLIVAEGARHRVRLTFGEYLEVGVPVTLLTPRDRRPAVAVGPRPVAVESPFRPRGLACRLAMDGYLLPDVDCGQFARRRPALDAGRREASHRDRPGHVLPRRPDEQRSSRGAWQLGRRFPGHCPLHGGREGPRLRQHRRRNPGRRRRGDRRRAHRREDRNPFHGTGLGDAPRAGRRNRRGRLLRRRHRQPGAARKHRFARGSPGPRRDGEVEGAAAAADVGLGAAVEPDLLRRREDHDVAAARRQVRGELAGRPHGPGVLGGTLGARVGVGGVGHDPRLPQALAAEEVERNVEGAAFAAGDAPTNQRRPERRATTM